MAKTNPIDKTLSILPYVRQLFSDSEVQKINNKYEIFSDATVAKERSIQRLSITNQYDKQMEFSAQGGRIPNMYYQQLMYSQSSDDKKRRIIDYRVMAQYPEVESAIREICDEMFVKDDQSEIIKCRLNGEYNDETSSLIEKEFQKFAGIFKFDEKGWHYAKDFIVEGELHFENIVSSKKPNLGIIGVTRIDNSRIDPLYYDLDNELIDCFLLRAKIPDQYPFQWGRTVNQAGQVKNNQQLLFLNDKQITYVANSEWESQGKKYKIPHLANAHGPYRQLSLIEDATVIYMLVRAPERLVFNIDTGTMQAAKAEQYIRRLMTQFWQKKTIGNDGRIENTYDPVSMLENYYFAKPRDGSGSTVASVGGGNASPDNLEILNFFVQKLYKSLHVPLARLNSETAFSDGESITREELRFAKFIISIQKLIASAIKKAFIVHLKLRGRKLLENAKKLGVTEIPNNPNKNREEEIVDGSSFGKNTKVSDVFKDNFNFKCWDYYDVIVEEIDKRVNDLTDEYLKKKDSLIDRLYTINERLEEHKLEVLTEDAEPYEQESLTLLAEAEAIGNQIDEYDNKLAEIKEVKDDNTSWWDQYDLKEEDIDVKFNEPSQFFALREQQIFQLKYDNFNNMSQNDLISNTFAQKIYLGYKDPQILANQEFLRRDAALRWELAQIEQSGPDFREKAAEEMKSAMEEGGQFENLTGGAGAGFSGGGGGGGSLPAGDTDLPSFGAPTEGGGEGGAGGTEGGGESLPAAGGKPASAPGGGESEGGGKPPSAPTGESYSRDFLKKMDILLESE
jgi:hypothetical protein